MRGKWVILSGIVGLMVASIPQVGFSQGTSVWVRSGESGRLIYGADDLGDRIMDFSRSGYLGGSALPEVSALNLPVINVAPAGGTADSLGLINAAIEQAKALPIQDNGYRAVVQLSAGEFRISNSIRLDSSGIILRGAGSGTNLASNTQLTYTSTANSMITVSTSASRQVTGSKAFVTDKVVPAGVYGLSVDSVAGFSVGDRIVVHRPTSAEWTHDIKMDQSGFPAKGSNTVVWGPGSNPGDQYYERVITHVDPVSNRIMLDAPLPTSLEAKYGDASTTKTANGVSTQYGATISHYTFDRISHIGIENIRGHGRAGGSTTSTSSAASFISVDNTENAWVRNVAAEKVYLSAVTAGRGALHLTVDGASNTNQTGGPTSGGHRYSFQSAGQYTLMQNLTSNQSRHDFVNNTPSRGPNVFLNGVATNSQSMSGPHQRWSTGTLYDNIKTNNGLEAQNAGNWGTGHGWRGANMVFWNSQGSTIRIQNPPTAQNWVVGSKGTVYFTSANATVQGSFPAYQDSHNNPVTLYVNGVAYTSLYEAQLADRLARGNEVIRHYVVGDYDGYESGDAADAPHVAAAWHTAIGAITRGMDIAGFDTDPTSTTGIAVPFTFDGLINPQAEHITSAVLTLALRRSDRGDSGDRVYVDAIDNFLDLPNIPIPMDDSRFASRIYTLEFTADDPVLNLSLLQDGQLNLLITKDQSIDWADIQFTVAPGAVPEPGAIGAILPAMLYWLRPIWSRQST